MAKDGVKGGADRDDGAVVFEIVAYPLLPPRREHGRQRVFLEADGVWLRRPDAVGGEESPPRMHAWRCDPSKRNGRVEGTQGRDHARECEFGTVDGGNGSRVHGERARKVLNSVAAMIMFGPPPCSVGHPPKGTCLGELVADGIVSLYSERCRECSDGRRTWLGCRWLSW